MSRGGARNRSGPTKDPLSRTSERAGIVLTALPNEGYKGEPPAFPLMPFTVTRVEIDGKKRTKVTDDDATEMFREREAELWALVWTYPQACAWALEPWRWTTVAMWVRNQVVCERTQATAADKAAIHRYADQIGMTPAGLKENGWKIAEVQVGAGALRVVEEPAAEASPAVEEPPAPRRLRAKTSAQQ